VSLVGLMTLSMISSIRPSKAVPVAGSITMREASDELSSSMAQPRLLNQLNGEVQGIDDILVYSGFSCLSTSTTGTRTPTGISSSKALNLIEALISLGNFGTFTQLLNATGANPELDNEQWE
jgi:hypothetical protein